MDGRIISPFISREIPCIMTLVLIMLSLLFDANKYFKLITMNLFDLYQSWYVQGDKGWGGVYMNRLLITLSL